MNSLVNCYNSFSRSTQNARYMHNFFHNPSISAPEKSINPNKSAARLRGESPRSGCGSKAEQRGRSHRPIVRWSARDGEGAGQLTCPFSPLAQQLQRPGEGDKLTRLMQLPGERLIVAPALLFALLRARLSNKIRRFITLSRIYRNRSPGCDECM